MIVMMSMTRTNGGYSCLINSQQSLFAGIFSLQSSRIINKGFEWGMSVHDDANNAETIVMANNGR